MKDRFIIKDMGEEGVVVYDQKQGEVHFLNPMANLIWNLSRENKTSEEIERTLQERFHSEDRGEISLDIETCLRELREKELLSLPSPKKRGIKKRKQKRQKVSWRKTRQTQQTRKSRQTR
jgi:PqqD family protein of HPr-rel-A system